MQEPEFQTALRERMWKIEGINEAKNQHGLKRARYRGLDKVQIQANMVGAVLNIKRLVSSIYALLMVILALKVLDCHNSIAECYKKRIVDIIYFLNRARTLRLYKYSK